MKTITVTLPHGFSPSEMIEVMTALKPLEDHFEVVVDFEKPVGRRQDGVVLPRDAAFIPGQPVDVPTVEQPSLFDLIDRPLPGVEEEEVNLRRRVVRDD